MLARPKKETRPGAHAVPWLAQHMSCVVHFLPSWKLGTSYVVLYGLVLLLVTTYGCGDKVPERSSRAKLQPFDMCAWADFAEDVQKAVDPYLGMEKLPGRARDIYPIGIRY